MKTLTHEQLVDAFHGDLLASLGPNLSDEGGKILAAQIGNLKTQGAKIPGWTGAPVVDAAPALSIAGLRAPGGRTEPSTQIPPSGIVAPSGETDGSLGKEI